MAADTRRETRFAYDELNRLSRVHAPTGRHFDGSDTAQITELRYDYDEFSNRRHVHSQYNKAGESSKVEDYWYLYDIEGRVTFSQGQLKDGQIVAYTDDEHQGDSVAITYDKLGRRRSAETFEGIGRRKETRIYNPTGATTGPNGQPGTAVGYEVTISWNKFKKETYFYDAMNLLTGIDSQSIRRDYSESSLYEGYKTLNWLQIDPVKLVTRREYDLRGYQITDIEYDQNGVYEQRNVLSYHADGRLLRSDGYNKDNQLKNRTRYDFDNSYDAVGNQTYYRYEQLNGNGDVNFTQSYTLQYDLAFAGDVNTRIHVTDDNDDTKDGYTENVYDSRGQLSSVRFNRKDELIRRYFSYDREGHVLTKGERKNNYGGSVRNSVSFQ